MRAFVAIDLPEDLRTLLRQKEANFRALCPDARWTQPAGIHLTLKFLGNISDARTKDVNDALMALGSFDHFMVRMAGFGFFPDARRPRVFWAGIDAPPGLAELAGRIEDAMERLGFAREQRDFNPHLTLARFKTPRPQHALEEALQREPKGALSEFEVSDFFLFESKLTPQGAQYRKIARFPRQ